MSIFSEVPVLKDGRGKPPYRATRGLALHLPLDEKNNWAAPGYAVIFDDLYYPAGPNPVPRKLILKLKKGMNFHQRLVFRHIRAL